LKDNSERPGEELTGMDKRDRISATSRMKDKSIAAMNLLSLILYPAYPVHP
jgi:hypothetical protein